MPMLAGSPPININIFPIRSYSYPISIAADSYKYALDKYL